MEFKMLNIECIKQSAIEVSNNELYIPLQGKHTSNSDEEPFDLAEKINSFFVFDKISINDPKVMLLMGDAGSGKSMFSQQLYQQLWKRYKSGDPIPLWIPLPELENPFESAVEEVLKKYEYSESQIAEMKEKERFLFIVDGYDECHQFQNCYVTNKWDKWDAKVLITCRSQALYYQKDPDKYFMPFNEERRLPLLLRRLYIASFSKEQISAYVKQYQALHADHKIVEEDFAKVPGLVDLMTTPFLLHCAVEALPEILASQVNDEKMTQAKLYDVFIEQWFTRQVKKLSVAGLLTDTEAKTKQLFWDYCKKLAQNMHEQEVSVIPYQKQKVGGRLFGKPVQTTTWERFFNEHTEVLRSSCPLKRVGDHHYGFIHASMIEYFATRAMYEEIQEYESYAQHPVIASEAPQSSEMLSNSRSLRTAHDDGDEPPRKINQPRGGIHQRLFAKEKNSIRFIADRIEMSEAFKQKMLAVLEASKKSEQYAIGAANAITALVKAKVTFNRQNLSGIKISGADISGGYFDQADLSAADLRLTQMRNVWMREANIEGSNVEGINFGEYPSFDILQDDIGKCFDYREDLNRLVTISGMLILWDTIKYEKLCESKSTEEYVTCVQFSPDGKFVVSGTQGEGAMIQLWKTDNLEEIALLKGHTGIVESVAFSPDGENVVSGSYDKTVRIWNVRKAELRLNLIGHEDCVNSVQFSSDGEWVVSGSSDGTIRIWAVASGDLIGLIRPDGVNPEVHSVQFSSDARRIVSDCGSSVQLWDVESKKLIATFHGHESQVNSVAFSPEGDRVVSGSEDYTVRVWDTISQKVLLVLRGHGNIVNNVQFGHNGKRVISGSSDKTLRIWDVEGEQLTVRTWGHKGSIHNIQHSPDGRLMASSSQGSTLRISEVASGKECIMLGRHDGEVYSIQFSFDGKLVVSGGVDGIVRLWEIESGRLLRELIGHKSLVRCVVFSLDGKRLVSGSGADEGHADNSIRLWEINSGKELMSFQGHEKTVLRVAFSHDGNRVFSASLDNTLRVWEVSSGRELGRWDCKGSVFGFSFSSYGDYAACYQFISGDPELCIVEMGNGATIFEMPSELYIVGFEFIGDNQHIIICLHKTIQIWDIANRQCIKVWNFHDIVTIFSYHPNGNLIVGFYDHSIECWQLTVEKNIVHMQLQWSTNIDSSTFYVEGLRISHLIGLSDQNRRLLEQRGANLDAKAQLNSNSLTKLIMQRAGSPIHHKPDLQRLQREQPIVVLSEEDPELKELTDQDIMLQNRGEIEEKNDMDKDTRRCHRCVII